MIVIWRNSPAKNALGRRLERFVSAGLRYSMSKEQLSFCDQHGKERPIGVLLRAHRLVDLVQHRP